VVLVANAAVWRVQDVPVSRHFALDCCHNISNYTFLDLAVQK